MHHDFYLPKRPLVVPELLVQPVEVGEHVVVFESQVQQLAKVEDFGFEESVDEQVVEGRRNMIFSPFEWLMLGNFGLCFESKD
jgi:hypothetical protein